MAGFAGRQGMGSQQWKSVLVFTNGLYARFPTQHRVAVLTSGAEPPSVDIGVAILALLADVGKDFLNVTRGTGYALMHSPQRVPRLRVMAEFRIGPDRTPTRRSVAVLARNLYGTVRISGCRILPHQPSRRKEQQTGNNYN